MSVETLRVLSEMAPSLVSLATKKAPKTVKAVKAVIPKELHAKVSVNVLTQFSFEIVVDFERVIDPKSMKIVNADIVSAIHKSDTEGYIFALEEDGSAEHYLDAIISGLRPGMVIRAEAFFPTLIYRVRFKQIIKK